MFVSLPLSSQKSWFLDHDMHFAPTDNHVYIDVRDRSVTPRYGDVATRDSGGEEQTTGHGMTVLVEKYIYLYLLAPAPNICTKTNKHKSALKPYSQLAY